MLTHGYEWLEGIHGFLGKSKATLETHTNEEIIKIKKLIKIL